MRLQEESQFRMNALHDNNPRKGKQEATLSHSLKYFVIITLGKGSRKLLSHTHSNPQQSIIQLWVQNGHFHKSLLVLKNEPR